MTRLRTSLLGGLVLSAAFAATCAPYQRMHIESQPPGAEVYLDKQRVGTTPLELRIPTGAAHGVFVKKEGFRPQLVVLENHEATDGVDFLTPADVLVRLQPVEGAMDRDIEVEVESERRPGRDQP